MDVTQPQNMLFVGSTNTQRTDTQDTMAMVEGGTEGEGRGLKDQDTPTPQASEAVSSGP